MRYPEKVAKALHRVKAVEESSSHHHHHHHHSHNRYYEIKEEDVNSKHGYVITKPGIYKVIEDIEYKPHLPVQRHSR